MEEGEPSPRGFEIGGTEQSYGSARTAASGSDLSAQGGSVLSPKLMQGFKVFTNIYLNTSASGVVEICLRIFDMCRCFNNRSAEEKGKAGGEEEDDDCGPSSSSTPSRSFPDIHSVSDA